MNYPRRRSKLILNFYQKANNFYSFKRDTKLYTNFRFKIVLNFAIVTTVFLVGRLVMLKNIGLVVVCCFLVACSSRQPEMLSEETFFFSDIEKSKQIDVISGTCQKLGWNIEKISEEGVSISIKARGIELWASVVHQGNSVYVIKLVKILCVGSGKNQAYKMFNRYAKNLKKNIGESAMVLKILSH